MLCKGNIQILFIVHLIEWNSLEIFWKLNCIYCDFWLCPRIKQRSEAFWRLINYLKSSKHLGREHWFHVCQLFLNISLVFLSFSSQTIHHFILLSTVYSKEFERKIVEWRTGNKYKRDILHIMFKTFLLFFSPFQPFELFIFMINSTW